MGPRVSLQHLLGKLGSRARPRSVIGLSWKRPRKSWFFPAWHPGPSPAAPRYLWLKIGAPGLGPAVNMGVSQCRGLGTCSGRAQDVGVSRALRGDGARRAGGSIHQHRQGGGGEKGRQRERWGTDRKDARDRGTRQGRGLNQMEAGSLVGKVPSTRQKLWGGACLHPVGVASVSGAEPHPDEVGQLGGTWPSGRSLYSMGAWHRPSEGVSSSGRGTCWVG